MFALILYPDSVPPSAAGATYIVVAGMTSKSVSIAVSSGATQAIKP